MYLYVTVIIRAYVYNLIVLGNWVHFKTSSIIYFYVCWRPWIITATLKFPRFVCLIAVAKWNALSSQNSYEKNICFIKKDLSLLYAFASNLNQLSNIYHKLFPSKDFLSCVEKLIPSTAS